MLSLARFAGLATLFLLAASDTAYAAAKCGGARPAKVRALPNFSQFYPDSEREHEGVVTATIKIDSSGRVQNCTATGMGPQFTDASCKALLRTRFDSALNEYCRPIAIVQRQKIHWKHPDDEPTKPASPPPASK